MLIDKEEKQLTMKSYAYARYIVSYAIKMESS